MKAASVDVRYHYKDWDPATRGAADQSHRRAEFVFQEAMANGASEEGILAACDSALDWEALMFVDGHGDEVTPACRNMPNASASDLAADNGGGRTAASGAAPVPRKRRPHYWKTYKRTLRPGYWTAYRRAPRPAGYWMTYGAQKRAQPSDSRNKEGARLKGQRIASIEC